MDPIKITALPPIGNNIAGNTLVPVVNMTGTPTTQKATIANIANTILSQAGNLYTSAGLANMANFAGQAGSVSNAMQPNITSVGVMANLTVEGLVNLGSVANLIIYGGDNGYVLQTDGEGSLSWTAQTGGGGGNGTPGGANTQVQFNDAGTFGGNSGFTFNKTTGVLSSPVVDTAIVNHLDGTTIRNSDDSHGATSALILPSNGNSTAPVQVTNTYGNITLTTGITAGSLKTWTFDNNGYLTLPNNTFAIKYANGTQIPLDSIQSQIANGTSNVNIATSGGAVTVKAGSANAWTFNTDGTLTTSATAVINPVNDNFNIQTANTNGAIQFFTDVNGNARNWLFDGYGFTSLPNTFGYTNTAVITQQVSGNIIISAGAGPTKEFKFGDDGTLKFPNDGVIDNSDSNFEVRGVENVNFEANAVVNIYTDTSGNAYQWQFGDDGNLTLPGNTFAVNYANGAQVQIGGGGNTYPNGFTYVLDDRLVSGEFEVNNSDPSQVSTISINPQTGNINVDELMTYLNDKNVVVTLADTSGNQAKYSVDSISPFIVGYNGYKALFTKQWGDDPGFSKIAFFKDTANATAITQTDTNDDEFTINVSGSSDLLGVAIIYTSNDAFIPTNANLIEYFEYFVDNILTPATNIADIKTFFYDQIINTAPLVAAWGEDPWNLEFYTNGVNSLYTSVASTTGGSGTGFTADIIPAGDGSYRILSFTGGTGYQVYDNITFSGSDLGGTSPTHDLVLEVATVNGSGAVLTFGQTGVSAGIWPTNNISDGGSDIYDTGNYLNTNLQPTVPYSDGELQNTGAFNTNDWFVGYAYGQFIFFGDNSGDQVSSFGTHGETGADGDGFRETGNLSPVEYYDLNVNSVLSYSSGMTLTGGTYQISFDNGGVNTNGVAFDQGNVNTITTTAGDLYIKAADDVRIRPADLLQLKGGDKTLPGSSGGYVNMSGGQGSPAVTTPGSETNAASGGDIEIYGGTAGYDGSNSSLGAQGGRVYIEGGSSSGNNNGGEIRLMGGNPSGTGTRGNIIINLDYDTVFKYDGSIIFPTKTVDLHNGGSQNAQLLQFGNPDLQAVITGPTPAANVNAQRLIIQGQRGNGTFSEGGDVYVWGGDAETNGGDIKIYAGDADDGTTGSGGYVNIDGGAGFDNGGDVTLDGGYSANGTGGDILIRGGYGATGGEVEITGGQSSTNDGGNITLIGGYGQANGGIATIRGGQSALGLANYGNVQVQSGASTWTFDNAGNLTLPSNSFAVNYANGDQVSLGSAALGNLTVSNITLQGIGSPYGDDGLNLAPGPDSTANLQYFRVRGGDYPTHIHFDTGNNEAYDQYFGNDSKYLKLGLGIAGNVSIGTYQDGGVGQLEWIFDSNGNLILAGGNSLIQSFANSSLDPLNPNVSTMILTPDQGYGSQALVLDPTAPGHIHLRAPSANIDEPYANLFLGGETSSFEVGAYYGTAPNVFIHSNDNTWTFDTSGSLIFPRDAVGNTDPYLVINGGTIPSIGSIDASQAGPANLSIVSDYLNLTGYSGAKVAVYADDGEIITDANMVLTTNDANVGNAYSWTLALDGTLSLPTSTYGYAQLYTTGANLYLGNSQNPINIQTDGTISSNGNVSANNVSLTGNITGNTNGYTIGYLDIPQVSASNTTIGLTDAGKHYYSTTAGNITLTVPLNSSIAFPTGTAISIVVQAAGNILVNAAAGVTLYMAGNSTSANRVVGTYGMATLMKVASDTWFINGTGVS